MVVLLAPLLGVVLLGTGRAPAGATDVPARHWAQDQVRILVGNRVMDAPQGRFRGQSPITRTELALALAAAGRALETHLWPVAAGPALAAARAPRGWEKRSATRYDAAVAIFKVTGYLASTLRGKPDRRAGDSEALPDRPTIGAAAAGGPAAAALRYLVRARMVWPDSVLLNPGSDPVTCAQLAKALAQFSAGAVDRMTAEPEIRPDIDRRSP